jgi:hypothetical protein
MTITRWDYSKQFSQYHFDPTVNEDADPHYKLIGRVEGDLAAVYEQQLKVQTPKANSFLSRFKVQRNLDDLPFTAEYDQAELEYLNLPLDHTFFYNLPRTGNETVQRILDSFKFERCGGSFHIQRPGGIFPYHIDEIPSIKDNDPNSWLDTDPKWAARFEIQVFDWQPGHVWAVGNTYWKQWKAGDILWHDWRHTPHGTCNFGRSDRVTLQVTGVCSEETLEIIKNCDYVFKI